MVVVTVPKTPTSAYNTDRPVSSLLISQIERLQRVVLEAIQTEGQAAEYIRALTRRVSAAHPSVEPRRHGPKRKRAVTRRKKRVRTAPVRSSASRRKVR
jgi:hypothetical protein